MSGREPKGSRWQRRQTGEGSGAAPSDDPEETEGQGDTRRPPAEAGPSPTEHDDATSIESTEQPASAESEGAEGPAEPSGAPATAPDAPTTPAFTPGAANPDRAYIQALVERLKVSGAELMTDVRDITVGLERYVQSHLLSEESEVARLRRRAERAEQERDDLARQLQELRAADARAAARLRELSAELSERLSEISAGHSEQHIALPPTQDTASDAPAAR